MLCGMSYVIYVSCHHVTYHQLRQHRRDEQVARAQALNDVGAAIGGEVDEPAQREGWLAQERQRRPKPFACALQQRLGQRQTPKTRKMMSSMDASALSRQNQKDVRPMLDLVDEMRRLGVEKEVPLPQIAVMGDQSCGKSSVLENIVGR